MIEINNNLFEEEFVNSLLDIINYYKNKIIDLFNYAYEENKYNKTNLYILCKKFFEFIKGEYYDDSNYSQNSDYSDSSNSDYLDDSDYSDYSNYSDYSDYSDYSYNSDNNKKTKIKNKYIHTHIFLKALVEDTIKHEFIKIFDNYLDKKIKKYDFRDFLTHIFDAMKCLDKDDAIKVNTKLWLSKTIRKKFNIGFKFKYGLDYLTTGLFSWYNWNTNPQINYLDKIADSYDLLIEDKTTHENLLEFVYTYINNNKYYLQFHLENQEQNNKKNKTSPEHMNYLILKIMFKIKNSYLDDFDKIISTEEITINSLSNSNMSIGKKIWLNLMYAIKMYYIFLLKNYFSVYATYETYIKENIINRNANIDYHEYMSLDIMKKSIKTLKKLIKSSIKEDIEKEYIYYIKNYKYMKSDDVIADIIIMFDVCNMTHIDLSQNVYQLIIEIMGGLDNMLKNNYLRKEATNIFLEISKNKGFDIFKNIMPNFSNYINNVKFNEIMTPDEALDHYNLILGSLIFLIDYDKNATDKNNMTNIIINMFKISFDAMNELKELISIVKSDIYVLPQKLINYGIDIIQYIISIFASYRELSLKNKINVEDNNICAKFAEISISFLLNLINKNHYLNRELCNIRINKEFMEIIIDCIYTNLSEKIIENLAYKLDLFEKLKTSNLIKSHEKLNIIIEKLKEHANIKKIEIPNEFLDPILYIEINDPIMIPDSNEIFERSVIETRIEFDPVNPYSRNKLTKEILNYFNKKEDIIQKIKDFKQRKQNWLNSL
jgi:hypothetical protein